MLAASFFSLLLPALAHARAQIEGGVLAVSVVILGLLCGAAGLDLMHRFAPYQHFITGREGPARCNLATAWLMAGFALTMFLEATLG